MKENCFRCGFGMLGDILQQHQSLVAFALTVERLDELKFKSRIGRLAAQGSAQVRFRVLKHLRGEQMIGEEFLQKRAR